VDDTLSDKSSSARAIAATIEAALYEKAIRLLSRREHSRAELSTKLAAKTPVSQTRRKAKAAKGAKATEATRCRDEDRAELSPVVSDSQQQAIDSVDTG